MRLFDDEKVIMAIDLLELWDEYIIRWEKEYDEAISQELTIPPPDMVGFMKFIQEELTVMRMPDEHLLEETNTDANQPTPHPTQA